MMASHRMNGKVKFFNSVKGFGFIIPENAPWEVFVHHTSIINDGGFRSLAEGELVEFDVFQGPKGMQATNVSGPNGAPVQGDPNAKPIPKKSASVSGYHHKNVNRTMWASPMASLMSYIPAGPAVTASFSPSLMNTSVLPALGDVQTDANDHAVLSSPSQKAASYSIVSTSPTSSASVTTSYHQTAGPAGGYWAYAWPYGYMHVPSTTSPDGSQTAMVAIDSLNIMMHPEQQQILYQQPQHYNAPKFSPKIYKSASHSVATATHDTASKGMPGSQE